MMFTPCGMIRCIRSAKSANSRNNAQLQVAQGWATRECWGPVGVGKQLLGSCAVLRTCPRIFNKVAELGRCSAVTTAQKLRAKRVFTPFCKGLGPYCNGFWGCRALSPHDCNRSDLSHSIKEVEIVRGKYIYRSIGRSSHRPYPAYLIGECVDQRKRGEHSGCLCIEALKRERETTKKCAVGTLYTLYCI